MQLASLLRGRPSPAARLARCHLLLGKLCALHVHGRAAAVAAATAASPLAAAASNAPTSTRAKTTTPAAAAAAAAAAASARSTHAAPTTRAAAATTRRSFASYDPACSIHTPTLPASPLVPRATMPASVHAIAAVPSAAATPAATSPTATPLRSPRGSSARTPSCFVHQPRVWLGVWGNAGHRERLGLCRRRRVSVSLWGTRLHPLDRARLKCGVRELRRRDDRPLPFAQRHSRQCHGRAARRL